MRCRVFIPPFGGRRFPFTQNNFSAKADYTAKQFLYKTAGIILDGIKAAGTYDKTYVPAAFSYRALHVSCWRVSRPAVYNTLLICISHKASPVCFNIGNTHLLPNNPVDIYHVPHFGFGRKRTLLSDIWNQMPSLILDLDWPLEWITSVMTNRHL